MCTMEVVGMDVLMKEGHYGHLEHYSGCSSISTVDQDDTVGWNAWSPVVDWGPLCTDADDFHCLIESMSCHNDADAEQGPMVYEPSSTTASEGTPPPPPVAEEEEGDDKGLRLVHLLMAAAEALTGAHKSRDLARVILVRLRELVSLSGGTNMVRIAAHFTDALGALLDSPAAGGQKRSASVHTQRDEVPHQQPSDVLAAFQLLQDMSPYVKFGHFTANQAILESITGDRRVHIIDFDIFEGLQWASLMQAMVSQKDGPPPPHLRITAINRGSSSSSDNRKSSISSVQETGRRLVAFAASIGLPFSFAQCRLDADEKFRPSAIKAVKGESVIANCILHPPHRSATSVSSFLCGAATVGAKLITLVEEECEIRKGEDGNNFVSRFMDELHRYSAVYDSLEAGFPMQGRARGLVERVILRRSIASSVARAYREREERYKNGGWGDWMSSMGFGRIGISFFNHCQARLLLGLFNDGYKIEEDAPNKLVMGWKSRRLISASIWSALPPSPPPSTTTSGFSS